MGEDDRQRLEASPGAKWVIKLGGGEWATVKYGVVEYLRPRPKVRAAAAITGLLWLLGWLASTAGYKWHYLVFPTISALFVTPTLLWLAVVSGPDFRLAFDDTKKPDPQVTPVVDAKGVLDIESYGIEALNKSYVSADGYARSSFRWSMVALIAGITCGCGNAWLISTNRSWLRVDHSAFFIWMIASSMLLLCVIFLIRSMVLFKRSARIHDRLLDLQRTITAVKYLERTQGNSAQIDPALVFARLLSADTVDRTER